MSNFMNDKKPEESQSDQQDEVLKSESKPIPKVRLFISAVGLLFSIVGYFFINIRIPSLVLFLIIVFINYREDKKEYDAELNKEKAKRERRRQKRLDKQNSNMNEN